MSGIVPPGMCPGALDADCPYRQKPTIFFCEFHEKGEVCPYQQMMLMNERQARRGARRRW